MGAWESIFGGDNQVGFFGGGQRVLDPRSYQLDQYQPMQEMYGGLAQRALGMQTPMRAMTPEEAAQERNRVMLEVAAGRLPPSAVQELRTQVAAGAPQPLAQPQDMWRGQQEQLSQSLFGTLSGQTPSVAQEQLRQATQGNIANAYAMAQSGRYNPGAARMAANQAANANQQAAGQAALLRAQEVQNAQGMLGNVLGTGRSQDIGQFQTQNQVAQGYLGQNLQMNQAQLAARMQQEQQAAQNFGNAQQNAVGGRILNAAGGVLGGMAGKGMFGAGKAYGGVIPGYASGGDSPGNDTVPAMLSPGEIVLPRTVAMDEDAPEKAKLFVAAIKAKRMKRAA